MMRHYIATALGGALGATLRVTMGQLLPASIMHLPLPVLFINVAGCFVMGILTELMAFHWLPSDTMKSFLLSGFLGGFTTFSAFAWEFGKLFQRQEFMLSCTYSALSVGLSIAFFFIGIKIVRFF